MNWIPERVGAKAKPGRFWMFWLRSPCYEMWWNQWLSTTTHTKRLPPRLVQKIKHFINTSAGVRVLLQLRQISTLAGMVSFRANARIAPLCKKLPSSLLYLLWGAENGRRCKEIKDYGWNRETSFTFWWPAVEFCIKVCADLVLSVINMEWSCEHTRRRTRSAPRTLDGRNR